jgi:hypothetical protein
MIIEAAVIRGKCPNTFSMILGIFGIRIDLGRYYKNKTSVLCQSNGVLLIDIP